MLKMGERTRKRPLAGKVRTFTLITTSSEGYLMITHGLGLRLGATRAGTVVTKVAHL